MVCQSFVTHHRGTKSTMGLLYLILSLLLNDKVHSAFEVTMSQNPLSWERALHHCNKIRSNLTFAVPDVNLSSMTVLEKIDLQGEAWVGYFQTYEHFLFIVCVPFSALESFVTATFNIRRHNNRPGFCYSLCGLQEYIGLQAGLCYCIETKTFSTADIHRVNSSCEKLLHCDNGMHCGHDESKKISVYKKVTISSTSSNDIRGNSSGCIIVSREYKMSLANCTNDRYQHLCESYTGQTRNLVESTKKDQWVYSIKDCTETGKNPTTFIGNRTNFIFPNSSGSWWTSVVQDLVIRNCSGCMTMNGTHLYEGFLKNSTEGIKLEFDHAEKHSWKTFVACMSEQPSNEQENRTNEPTEIPTYEVSTMSRIPEQPSNAQENLSNEPTEIPKTYVTSEASTMSRIPEQPSNAQENRTNEPTEIPISSATSEASTMSRIPVLMVILPVGLAVLALITVVTLAAVFWRRRKEKANTNVELSKQKTTKTVVPHNSERQQVYYEHKKETLNELEENDQGHVSSEYDSLNEYNAHFSAPTGNLYDTSNFNIGEEAYAVTFSANSLRQVADSNSYDHVRMKKTKDGKYDHVELQNQINIVNDIDTYDQGNALLLDNTYYDTFQLK